MTTFLLSNPVTSATGTPLAVVEASVGRVVGVAVRAVSTFSLCFAHVGSVSRRLIDGVRNDSQVIRANAASRLAQVVDLQAVRYRPYAELVSPAVGASYAPGAVRPASYSKAAVAIPVEAGSPQPTGLCELYLRPETPRDRDSFGAGSAVTHVVSIALNHHN